MLRFERISLSVSSKSGCRAERPRHERKQFVLDDCSGLLPSASLTGILGTSGTCPWRRLLPCEFDELFRKSGGKTTLLNALSGRALCTGTILADGREPSAEFFESNCAYVPQASVLLGTLTPREAVLFASRARLGNSLSPSQHHRHVDGILKQLGLLQCADSRIGDEIVRGISGGEKRRTSIALELVTRPKFLFLDEPTTGLDSRTALSLVQNVKGLTGDPLQTIRGRDLSRQLPHLAPAPVTVVASIHQPSSAVRLLDDSAHLLQIFDLLDNLIVLDHGRVVYCGSSKALVAHLARFGLRCPPLTNPAEYLFEDVLTPKFAGSKLAGVLISEQRRLRFVEAQLLSEAESKSPPVEHKSPLALAHLELHPGAERNLDLPHAPAAERPVHRVSWLQQLALLIGREWLNCLRLPLFKVMKVLQTVVLGLVVALTFLNLDNEQTSVQNRLGCIYFIILSQMFANALNVVLTFVEDRAVLLLEQSNRLYTVSAFFVAKSAVSAPFTAVSALGFSLICYFTVGLAGTASQFFGFLLVILFVSFAGESLGLVVGAAAPSRVLAVLLAPLAIAPFILFTSYALPPSILPPYMIPVKWLSPFWWAFEALAVNEFAGLKLRCTADQQFEIPAASPLNSRETVCRFTSGEQVLSYYHASTSTSAFAPAVLTLFGVAVFHRVAAFAVLKVLSARVQRARKNSSLFD